MTTAVEAAASNQEERVLLVIVDGEPDWWVFRPTKPLPPDWEVTRGHWYHPVSEEDASELRAKNLLDSDERAFQKRGLAEELPRFAAFRANVILRKVSKVHTCAVMCAEDVAVANEEFAARVADIENREKNGESVTVDIVGQRVQSQGHRNAAQGKRPATPTIDSVPALIPGDAAGDDGDLSLLVTSQQLAVAPRYEYRLIAASRNGDEGFLVDSTQAQNRLWYREVCRVASGTLTLFDRIADEPPGAVTGKTPLDEAAVQHVAVNAGDDAESVKLLFVVTTALSTTTTHVNSKSKQRREAIPRTATSAATTVATTATAQQAPPTPAPVRKGGAGITLRLTQPSRRAHRSETPVTAADPDPDNAPSASLLSTVGYRTWTVASQAPIPLEAGRKLTMPGPNTTPIVSLGDGRYVSSTDADSIKAASRASVSKAENDRSAPATDLAADYLEDLLESIHASKKPAGGS